MIEEEHIEQLQAKLKLAIRTLESAKENLASAIVSHYCTMGWEYLAEDAVACSISIKQINDCLKELERE